ncbi:MAG: response regulator [Armatimonadota bacterium]|nr:response regulator [Armatimonadota bacterium]
MKVPVGVLIVEDSEDDVLLITDELEENDFDLTHLVVETPEAMASALREQAWDLIIADYTMPRFSGPDALKVLRESGLDIPFILVSGTSSEDTGVAMMRAGAQDFILKRSLSRLGPAVKRELAEADSRRMRRKAEEAYREAEAHKHEFYRRTILAFTEGRLMITEPTEIAQLAGEATSSWDIRDTDVLSAIRSSVKKSLLELGVDEQRIYDFMGSAMEAATNALKHAGQGKASFHLHSDIALFVVSDTGPGIEALALPDVALKKGYSTSATLGMGYKVMIASADRIYLATGPEGTVVGIEMALQPDVSSKDAILRDLSGW